MHIIDVKIYDIRWLMKHSEGAVSRVAGVLICCKYRNNLF